MEFKDYYVSLGVSPDADEKTIKKAYQKLAKKYHPDVNPGDKTAEDKFKEATEAYEAIGDPEKRKKYDELRENYKHWQSRGERGNPGQWQTYPGGGFQAHNISPDEFADLFGGSRNTSGFNDMGGEFSDFFYTLFGGVGGDGAEARGFGRNSNRGRARAGQDLEVEVQISLAEAYLGTSRIIHTGEKEIEAKIPKGVRTGSKVRLSGQGTPGIMGGPNGNLYLLINVTPHANIVRDGDDLKITASIDFYKAALGGNVSIKTLNGEVMLKIPPLSQSGKKFRLKGKGMPNLEKNNQFGDLYVELSIVLPEGLSEQEIKTLQELAEKRSVSES